MVTREQAILDGIDKIQQDAERKFRYQVENQLRAIVSYEQTVKETQKTLDEAKAGLLAMEPPIVSEFEGLS